MTGRTFDVVGVGNALVDVLARVPESFLQENGLTKGTMRLMDAGEAVALYDRMPPAQETSGGSAANTLAALASLGGKGGFVSRIGNDELGDVFAHDLRGQSVAFSPAVRDSALPTGRCLIAVTPDGERTMNTALGCNVHFGPSDLDPQMIAAAKVVYLEGYLFDQPSAKDAYRAAADMARQAGCTVALTLSDRFCVERHRADFRALVQGHVDLLFANEGEITALYETPDFEQAAKAAAADCAVAVLTRSGKGAVIAAEGRMIPVPVVPVARVLDMTGAGDAFAAGFLYGYTHGLGFEQAGRIGACAAAEVIAHVGARPEKNLAQICLEAAA